MLKEDEKILILEKIKRFFSNNRFNYILFFCTYAKNIGFYFVHFFQKKIKIFLWNKNYTERYLFFFLL